MDDACEESANVSELRLLTGVISATIRDEVKWSSCSQLNGGGYLAHVPPNKSFKEEALDVGPPIAPGPTQALLQVFRVVFQCRLNLAFLVMLDPCFPLVIHHPSSEKVVVVGI